MCIKNKGSGGDAGRGAEEIQFELIARDDLHTKDYNTATHITIASGDGGNNQKNRDSHTKNVFIYFFFLFLFIFLFFFFYFIFFTFKKSN
jgi:hypothetical protein